MNAEHLAREIANEIMKSDPRILHSQIHRIRDIIAAHLAPLVSDAEKWRNRPASVDERTCHNCKNVAVHADNIIPYVTCTKCGSNDTRRKRGDT